MCEACSKPKSALASAQQGPESLSPCPEAMRELFCRHGIRCTTQRSEVYTALCAAEGHPTAEELHDRVRETAPGLSLATVYNTLDVLVKAGLVRTLPSAGNGGGGSGGGPCRFDAELRDHVHLHTPGGRVEDLPDELGKLVFDHLPAHVIERIEGAMGVKIDRVSVDLVGRPV